MNHFSQKLHGKLCLESVITFFLQNVKLCNSLQKFMASMYLWKEKKMSQINYDLVFRDYLKVCNKAIDKNKDKFPYKEIWGVGMKLVGQKEEINCVIYDDEPQGTYTLNLDKDNHLRIVEGLHPKFEDSWKFRYSYIKHVIDHPEEYINHPAKLDWDWLRSSMN